MKSNLPLKIGVSAAAILVASVHLWNPALRIDSISIVLLVIAVLPWTQPLIKSIELLGVKLELQELQEQVAEAKGAAASATRQAGLALAASASGPELEETRRGATPEELDEIDRLAQEYNRIRQEQPSGDARTAAMTGVVRRMIDLARRARSFDVKAALQDTNRGRRLFAYAYLYSRPDGQLFVPLVESVAGKEDKPFGQYWGLQAIGRVLPLTSREARYEIRGRLGAFAERVPSGTDRDYEIRKLLRQIDRNG